MHGDAVTGVDGHAHRRSGDVEIGQLEDLANLGVDLSLFARPAVLAEQVDLGNDAVGDPAMERRPGRLLAVLAPPLGEEGVEASPAGATHRLVARQVDRSEAEGVADGREDHDRCGGRAVRVRHHVPLATAQRSGVRLRNDEWHLGIEPEGAGVINDQRDAATRSGHDLAADRRVGGQEQHLEPRR